MANAGFPNEKFQRDWMWFGKTTWCFQYGSVSHFGCFDVFLFCISCTVSSCFEAVDSDRIFGLLQVESQEEFA